MIEKSSAPNPRADAPQLELKAPDSVIVEAIARLIGEAAARRIEVKRNLNADPLCDEATPQLLTPGEIATRLKTPLHKVVYAIRARNIAPIGRAGNLRIFDEAGLREIEQAIHSIGGM